MLLYIDPGTGSMLFTILIGIVGFLVYLFKVFWIKLKFLFTSGKQNKMEGNKIPYLIFAEVKRYWEVFKPICDEFEKRGIDVVYWTSSPDDPALEQKYEHVKFEFVGEGNKAFAKLNLVNASVVIATTPGLEVYQWKRSKFADHYIHILSVRTISIPFSCRVNTRSIRSGNSRRSVIFLRRILPLRVFLIWTIS